MRVLHVLHNSLPLMCGYSIRANSILQNQRRLGLQVQGVTSAQHPNGSADSEVIEEVTCHRTRIAGRSLHRLPLCREMAQMRALYRRVRQAIDEFKPQVVHAHSPVLVGYPALRAARAAGLPFVYEVRDLWENAAVDRGRFSQRSPMYRAARWFESYVLKHADAVVTIGEQLRRELAPRAGAAARVTVVDNGVDADTFSPSAVPSAGSFEKTGPMLFYAGTFQPYEGLGLLIEAFAAVRRQVPGATLVIAGGSASRSYAGKELTGIEAELQNAVDSLKLSDSVVFTGRIPHERVRGLYAAADLVIYPRLLTRTTALTTPLKPLEAMAMGRAVLVSDVPAMLELVSHGETGWTFQAGNRDALSGACIDLLDRAALRAELGAAARQYVLAERQWPTLAARYLTVYAAVTGRVADASTTAVSPLRVSS